MIFLVCIFFMGFSVYAQAKPVAIFYIPHQDDEFLSMGVAIVNHIWYGNEVHLVLYTDGRPSDGALNNLNNSLTAAGYPVMTKDEAILLRTNEFYRSGMALGVKHENIHLHFVDPTVEKLKELILYYELKYPGARHKAFSYHDMDLSHAVSGQALLELYNTPGITIGARFYVRHVQMDGSYGNEVIWGWYETFKASYQHYMDRAYESYTRWDPPMGFYAFGVKSIGIARFDDVKNYPRSKYHLPNQ